MRDKNIIDKIHVKQLEMLEIFHDICQKLNLKYTISSGTLLGAARHGGFIPWDDDTDVAMPREDYEIFIKEANKFIPEGFYLEHYSLNKNCINYYAKIMNLNTTWIVEENENNPNIKQCLSMDIFPIDRFDSPSQLNYFKRKNSFFKKLRWHYFIKAKSSSLLKKIASTILIYPISKLIGLKNINRMHDNNRKKYTDNKGPYTLADTNIAPKCFEYKLFEEFTSIEFEGKTFCAIKNYHTYLTEKYGDYMKLPPEDKRVVHLAKIIDLDKPYTDYIKIKK